MHKLDWSKISSQFHPSWHKKMQPIIESEGVYNIFKKLKDDVRKNKKITPLSKDLFKSFQVDLRDIKVVWLLQDPYAGVYKDNSLQASGIALDCRYSPDNKLQPSLEKFYDAISTEYGEFEYNKNLDYLVEQGNMFLNTDLTCELKKIGSHENLWEPFMKMIFENIFFEETGLIYVVCGKSSKRLLKYINPLGNYIFELSHPSAAAHQQTNWETNKIFSKCNQILKSNNGELSQIKWNFNDYKTFCNVPNI
jgi:uracil DNA glycosylase